MVSGDPRESIRARALEAGFDAVGFTAARPAPEDGVNLADFLAMGRHGDMDWMATTRGRRADPQALWPSARSVVALAGNYAPARDPRALQAAKGRGAISVYANSRDYHDVMKGRAKNLAGWIASRWGCDVKVFVDTAPVMEKPLAARAGLGWQGKHTNLVSRTFGSWLFLAEVFTTLEIPPDASAEDACGSCDACRQACPTGALAEPYHMDATRCISYLTIEHKGGIAGEFREAMGNRVYGCDDCLAACPWNKFAEPTREAHFKPRAELAAPRLADLAALDDAAFREVFAGTPIKRTGRDRLLRNVLIAIGNSGDTGLAATARARLEDASPIVREAAAWALSRLQGSDGAR